jgi:hypothetical protein
MKMFFPVSGLLILLVAVLLLSGCTIAGIPVSPEEEAKGLADQTAEAEFLMLTGQQFLKFQECTMEELESVIPTPPSDEEQRAQLASYLEQLKQCTPVLNRTATKQAENQYLVSYSFIPASGCGLGLFSEMGDFMQVEVNIGTKTANVVKGAISQEQIQTGQMMMQGLGNCAAMIMFMATASASARTTEP